MNALWVMAAAVYYVLLQLAVYLIYKRPAAAGGRRKGRLTPAGMPDKRRVYRKKSVTKRVQAFPRCLVCSGRDAAATGICGVLGIAVYCIFCGDIDRRIMLLYLMGILMLSVLTVTDLREKRIPNKVMLAAVCVWVGYTGVNLLISFDSWAAAAVSGLMGMVFNFVIFIIGYFLTGKKLGGGDVKLAAVMGLFFLMDRSFSAVMYALILCCLFSLVMLAAKKVTLKQQIPLCPFLLTGTIAALILT